MKQILYFISGLWIFISGFISCSPISDIGKKRFVFYTNDKERKLVYTLPGGRSEEKYKVGANDAKEQFYYFGDGSVFYVARQVPWPTVNKFRIEALPPKEQKSTSFSGKDSDGLYWKEIQFEEFKVGYAYVSAEKAERFNDALSSVKIR